MGERMVRLLIMICIAVGLSGCAKTTQVPEKERIETQDASASLEAAQPEHETEDVPVIQKEEPKDKTSDELAAKEEMESLKEEPKETGASPASEEPENTQEWQETQEADAEEEPDKKQEDLPLPDTQEEKELIPYQVLDVMPLVKKESDIDPSMEDKKNDLPEDIAPADTVEYVPSGKEEEVGTKQVESVVDEEDPSTYQIVQKEEEVEVEVPLVTEYVNPSGDVRYALVDGIWYEYKYSSGDISLDEKDEELALLLLNMDGSYDEFTLESIECSEHVEEDGRIQYNYHVRYQKLIALEGELQNTELLIPCKTSMTRSVQTRIVEERVPVWIEETYKTGEILYYGWQDLDGVVCYYDKDGNRVTGSQVIRGIRYEFNEEGVLISRMGIEVSSEHGEIDWEAVRAAGVDMVYIRGGYRGCVQGDLILDARMEEYIRGAKEAGLTTGLYLYSQAVSPKEAVEEASLLVMLAREYGVTEPLALSLSCATSEGTGRADDLSTEERTNCVDAFCQTVESAGYLPMIHTEKDWMEQYLHMETLSKYPLWLTKYDTEVTYARPCQIWQYTTKGTIDGVDSPVGLYMIYGG